MQLLVPLCPNVEDKFFSHTNSKQKLSNLNWFPLHIWSCWSKVKLLEGVLFCWFWQRILCISDCVHLTFIHVKMTMFVNNTATHLSSMLCFWEVVLVTILMFFKLILVSILVFPQRLKFILVILRLQECCLWWKYPIHLWCATGSPLCHCQYPCVLKKTSVFRWFEEVALFKGAQFLSDLNWVTWQITYRQCPWSRSGSLEVLVGLFGSISVEDIVWWRKCEVLIFGFLGKKFQYGGQLVWDIPGQIGLYLRKYKYLVKCCKWNVVYHMGIWIVVLNFSFSNIFSWFLGWATVWVQI